MAEPAICLEGVGMIYPGGVTALEGVNLAIAEGEFVALLGASGCGKSTLLRLVSGLEVPTAGTISVLGATPDAIRRRREIGMVFQDPALLPWRTVRQNIALPGEIFHDPAVRERVDEWIGRVGLAGFEKMLPAQLSGGMRSRVAIARALVFRPRVLMMDEPFGALDEITRADMHRELLSLWEEYRPTLVFVTHSIIEALYLADRVIVLSPRPGRITAVVEAPFPRPRDARLRHQPDFARIGDELLALLGG